MNRTFRHWLWRLLPVLVSIVILWYAFRGIPKESWRAAIQSVTLPLLGGFIIFSLAGTFLRLWRFSILLSHRVPVFDLFLITLVQNFSMDLLPARTAALAFFTYFTRRQGIDWEEGVSSFISTVVYDVLAVALLLSPALLFQREGMKNPLAFLAGLVGLIFGSLIFLRAAPPVLRWLTRQRRLHRPRLLKILNKAGAYFGRHYTLAEQTALLGISFLIKAAKYISIFTLFSGLTGAPVTLKSFFLFNFAVAAAEVSSYFPVQGLAGFGTWEAAFAIAVQWVGVSVTEPFLTAFIIHLITQAWEYSIGLIAFFILSYRQKRESIVANKSGPVQ